VKKEIEELIEWALEKGESQENIIDSVEKTYGKREAMRAAKFLGIDNIYETPNPKYIKKTINEIEETNSKKNNIINYRKIGFAIAVIVIIIVIFWLVKPLPIKSEFTFTEEWNYYDKKGIELTVLLETKNHIIKPTKWNLRSTFWVLRQEYSKYKAIRIIACTGFFTSAYAVAEYIDGKETKFELLR